MLFKNKDWFLWGGVGGPPRGGLEFTHLAERLLRCSIWPLYNPRKDS